MADEMDRHDPLIERISDRLRAVERADASFAERVMSSVRVSAETALAERRRHWLVRPRVVTLTPLAALALAAGFALAVIGVDGLVSRGGDRMPVAAATTDTVHVVRFVFTDSIARSVMLVGTFNDWTKGATPMVEQVRRGVWSVSVTLANGRYEYAFVVQDASGERWIADPAAMLVRGEFGTESSIVSVGGTT